MTPEEVKIIVQEVHDSQSNLVAIALTIAGTAFAICLTIIGFFLRNVYEQQKTNTVNLSKTMGRVNTLDEVSQTKLDAFGEKVSSLADELRSHTKIIEARMAQKDETHQVMLQILQNITSNDKPNYGSKGGA